jgi:hypothetical protein
MDVEDLLGESLVSVERRVEENQRESRRQQRYGAGGKQRKRDVPQANEHGKPLQ